LDWARLVGGSGRGPIRRKLPGYDNPALSQHTKILRPGLVLAVNLRWSRIHKLLSLLSAHDLVPVPCVFYSLCHHDCHCVQFPSGERINAHKLILTLFSPVFEAEFYGSLNQDGEILITDIGTRGLRLFSIYLASFLAFFAHINRFTFVWELGIDLVANSNSRIRMLFESGSIQNTVLWIQIFSVGGSGSNQN